MKKIYIYYIIKKHYCKDLKKKEEKKAERIQGNKVYYLKQVEKDLESKIKIQNNINNKMNRQYVKYVQKTLNDECVKNQL